MSTFAIELRDVQFAWKRSAPVLSVAEWNVRPAERVFLQGSSGSGKSTLLGVLGGVLVPQKGEVKILGREIGALKASERDRFRAQYIGFIFQQFNLIPYLSVTANVLLPLGFSRSRRERVGDSDAAAAEARRLLAALGLTDPGLLNRQVTELSIGQQQRVAAARALIGRPSIVIADEPTSALDADARTDFLKLLMGECAAHGATLVFVSHDASLGALFDRTCHMAALNAPEVKAAA